MGLTVAIGATFGYLTVVSQTDKRIKGAKVWSCQCKCGNTVETKTDYLQQGWKKSCGCLRSQKASARVAEVWAKNPKKNQDAEIYKFNTLVFSYKGGAKKRNLEFELTLPQIYDLVSGSCHYCGFKQFFDPSLNRSAENSQEYSNAFIGIDRKNSSLGYVVENVVSCCKICNIAKGNMAYSDFIQHLDRVAEFRKR